MSTDEAPPGERVRYRPESESYRVRFDPETDAPSVVVVEAIAEIEDEDPAEIEPLYRGIDPDALDGTIRSATDGGDTHVRFAARGYAIAVQSSGTVVVRP